MNTKGMKFLAVLAVLAMAFAAFAVIAPAETDDAEGATAWTFSNDPSYITVADDGKVETAEDGDTLAAHKYYYVPSTMTVTITKTAVNGSAVLLLLEEGASVTVNMNNSDGDAAIFVHVFGVAMDNEDENKLKLHANYGSNTTITGAWNNGSVSFPTELPGDNPLTCANQNYVAAAGDSYTITFAEIEHKTYASLPNSPSNIDSDVAYMAYGMGECTNCYADPTTWNFYNATGTVISNVAGLQKVDLTGFTGAFSITSGVITITTWSEGDLEVVKAANANPVVINAGCADGVLELDSGTFASLATTVDFNLNASGAGTIKLTNDISITAGYTVNSSAKIDCGTYTFTVNGTSDSSFAVLIAPLTSSAASTSTIVNICNYAVFEGTIVYDVANSADDAKASVALKAGNAAITIKAGSLKIAGKIDGTYPGSFIKGESNTYIGTTTITGGEVTVQGEITTDGVVTLSNATLNVDEYATLTASNTNKINLTETSVLNVAGVLSPATVTDTAAVTTNATSIVRTTGTGSVSPVIDVDVVGPSTMETQYVYDTALGTHTYPATQTLIVDGSWTLSGGDSTGANKANITVNGKLIVPEGSTLTIEDGAKLVISSGATFEVYGKLVIDEDEDSLPVTGTTYYGGLLSIENGAMTVSGQVLNGGAIVLAENQKLTLLEEGILTVEDSGLVATGAASTFTVSKYAKLNVLGNIDGSTIYNFGEVFINSDYAAKAPSTIYQMCNGAVTEVKLYTISAAYSDVVKLTISDEGLYLYTYRDSTHHEVVPLVSTETNKIEISATLNDTTGAITPANYNIEFTKILVQSSVGVNTDGIGVKYGNNYYTKTMDVSGTIDADYYYTANDDNARSDLTAKANVKADAGTSADGMIISDYIYVKDNSRFYLASGQMELTGTFTTDSSIALFDADAAASFTVTGDGIAMVYGRIITNETGVNATKIVIPTEVFNRTVKVNTYMTLDKALAYLASLDDEVGKATVLGTNYITADSVLYASDELTVNGTIYIGTYAGEDVTFTIKDGAKVGGAGSIYVNGTMFAENKSNVKIDENLISADVKTVQVDDKGKAVKDGWAKWTNVLAAIADPDAEVVEITRTTNSLQKYVAITSNMTIPEGVTLYVPAGAAPLVIYDGVTLTVDGTLQIGTGSQVYAQHDFNTVAYKITTTGKMAYSSTIIVNGALITSYAVAYENGGYGTAKNTVSNDTYSTLTSLIATGAPISGAYYEVGGYYVISSFDVAIASLDDIDKDFVTHGTVSAGDVVFTATEYVDKITVDNTEKNEKIYNGAEGDDKKIANKLTVNSLTIVCPSGISAAELTVDGNMDGKIVSSKGSVDVKGVNTLGVKVTSTGAMTLSGNFNISDKGDYLTVATGEVTVKDSTPVMKHYGVGVEPAKYTNNLTVASGATMKIDGTVSVMNLIVNGTLSVPATKILTVNYIEVYGALEVAKATTTSAAGSFTVAKATNDLGLMYIGISAGDITSAAASVSGPATLTNATVYVYNDATIDSTFSGVLKNLSATKFFVEEKLWFTVYAGTTPSSDSVVVNSVPAVNAVLKGWSSVNGGSPIKFDDASYYAVPLKNYSELYAVLDYEIYTVVIMADQGVKNVSIDGVLLSSGSTGTDTFRTVANIEAGTHTVTFALYSGHEGTAILQYVDATAGVTATILGMNFTVSGDNAGTVTLQLVGIEESDEPTPEEKSEWTITTILLVILVILIAVMAVIVALRLNRS